MPKKKASKKETPAKTPEVKTLEQGQISFDDDGNAILYLGSQAIRLSKNDVRRFIGQNSPGEPFLRAEELNPDDTFDDLNDVNGVAGLVAHMSWGKLSSSEIAKRMGISTERFIAWLNCPHAKKKRDVLLGGKREQILEVAEKIRERDNPSGDAPKELDLNHQRVGELFAENNNLDYVIRELKVNRADFLKWLQRNQKKVNKYMNRYANNFVVNQIMAEMQENQEKQQEAGTGPKYI